MKLIEKTLLTALVVSLLGCLISCTGPQIKPWSDRTSQEKALAILDMYNAQFKDTMTMALTPNLTESQKEIVRAKKRILQEVYPLIDVYISIIDGGGVPSQFVEQEILNLLNMLIVLVEE